ncbi:MAG: hypothetical protein ABGX31_02320 [bacterium]
MFFDVFLGGMLVLVIAVQYLMIHTYQKRLDYLNRQVVALAKYKEDKGHEHKVIQGSLDMEYRGQSVRCKATFHPKIMI